MSQSNPKRAFATRDLTLIDEAGNPLRVVNLTIFEPTLVSPDWEVEYEIIGLEKAGSVFRHRAMQIDSVGALFQALQLLAVEIRVSEAHKSGRLFWLEQGDDYGLPIRDEFKDL
jgi:hypothetical protein